jgi:hypothetical protein
MMKQSQRPTLADEHKARISASRTGKVWVTNGEKNTFVASDKVPDGFKRGKIQQTRRKE